MEFEMLPDGAGFKQQGPDLAAAQHQAGPIGDWPQQIAARVAEQAQQQKLNDAWVRGPIKIGGSDMVNHPPHYTQGGIECIDAIKAALGHVGFIAFLRGQVIKYLWRLNLKGSSVENAKKAAWYQARLLAELEEGP